MTLRAKFQMLILTLHLALDISFTPDFNLVLETKHKELVAKSCFLLMFYSYHKSIIKIYVKVQFFLLKNLSKKLITSITRVNNKNNIEIMGWCPAGDSHVSWPVWGL